jgi:dTDP-4-amino-4,6-dideoxygalactose transaminase
MDRTLAAAHRHNLKIIEDCVRAIETEYRGQKSGTFGELGCFSFYATKNIVTGEGGMVITDNEDFANKIKILDFMG